MNHIINSHRNAWRMLPAAIIFVLLTGAGFVRADDKPWTIVLLPDTQDYTQYNPEIFMKQTEWIVANKEKRDIRMVLHLGDITNRNTHPEWLNARHTMDKLVKAEIPFAIVPGNHDLGQWGSSRDRSTFMDDYFGWFDYRFVIKRGYLETGHLENTYQTIDTPWGPFLVLALEFFPRDKIIEGANKLASRFADHHAILLTHAYLYHDDTRYDAVKYGNKQEAWVGHYGLAKDPEGANDGEKMWLKLVSQHDNFLFTFSGHVLGDGTGYLVSKGKRGNEVHQMMVNFQSGVQPDRGPGYLRILEFQPDGRTINVSTYSPHQDKWIDTPDHQFVITMNKRVDKK